MNIHEYQAKEILRSEGVPIPPGEVASTPDQVEAIAKQYGGTVVVKAQVHAGGRGKRRQARQESAEARAIATRSSRAHQGTPVLKVLVILRPHRERRSTSASSDRASRKPVFV